MSAKSSEVTRPEKVLFPDAEVTKADLAAYFDQVAEVILPHLAGRPLVLRRYPDGVDRQGFVQQQASQRVPNFVDTETVAADNDRGDVRHLVANDVDTLRYLANQACLELHRWLSRADRTDHPDLLVLDLDRPSSVALAPLRRTARTAAELFEQIGLTPHLMATGSTGYHVVAPLDRSADFAEVRQLARAIAERMAADAPDELTTEQRVAKRGGRIFLDTNRNAYGQTAIAPYSPRARPGAPVATPLEFAELSRARPDQYDLRGIQRRLARKDDPWTHLFDHAAAARQAHTQLNQLHER
jgi:bifunctional non-homologous end joining protein LigD